MNRTFRITVNGTPYTVTVEDLTDEGQSLYPAPGTMATPAAPAAPAAPAPAAAPPPADATAAAGPGDEVSPLAGVIVEIPVSVGQSVASGDAICIVEAMKMKTTVVAHYDGAVKSIAVKAGDGVEAGQVIMNIG